MHSRKPSAKPSELARKYLPPAALLLFVALFGLTQNAFFALAAIISLAYLLYAEFKHTQDWKELLTSFAIALGAWIALSLLLNTTSPINIITSCSMLPDFERGDLIFLQGADSVTPTLSTPLRLQSAQYLPAEVTVQGQTVARIYQPTADGQAAFQPRFSTCARQPLDKSKTAQDQVCLKSIGVQGTDVSILASPDVVVFDSNTSAGLIIHRAFSVLNASDGPFLLTKGDNNNFLDQQSGFQLIPYRTAGRVLLNLPLLGALTLRDGSLQWITENDIPVKGKVLLRIPYIGYIKLLLFLQIQAPAGCDSVLEKPA
ncbi:hypothetical protein HYV43_03305 [Candidatus Micrarchaeota archaeon]|nr:hypothetical protein [Candidatus Micrarchaeota archaeon]